MTKSLIYHFRLFERQKLLRRLLPHRNSTENTPASLTGPCLAANIRCVLIRRRGERGGGLSKGWRNQCSFNKEGGRRTVLALTGVTALSAASQIGETGKYLNVNSHRPTACVGPWQPRSHERRGLKFVTETFVLGASEGPRVSALPASSSCRPNAPSYRLARAPPDACEPRRRTPNSP